MPKIYVLNVPEFAGLISCAQADPNVTISPVRSGYVEISSSQEICVERRAAGFKPAIWYSCCSGGVDGEIVEFGRDRLRIVDTVGG